MAEKVTIMKLKVDLQCNKCYKKVKKVLCKFPQIRDQIYDEKNNVVAIRVVCCSPEKLRHKLCCQGGGSIKSIEIVELPKPKPPKPEQPKPEPEKPKPPEPEQPKPKPEKPKPPSPVAPPEQEKVKSPPPPEPPKPDDAATPTPPTAAVKFLEPVPVSVLACPSPAASVGLCQSGLGGPTGFYGRPIYDSYGGSGHCYAGCHSQHLCEEDALVCRIT